MEGAAPHLETTTVALSSEIVAICTTHFDAKDCTFGPQSISV
jgi:hypothetical protein